ncbi:MAG: glutamate 5-kinase [Candidatus Weimeria sp.]|nr:glutamate 5-kinase [Lachnospiraceae bacterium]MEE3355325.1 glutamate 5-kinase [Candidatus Weimeria sp.]
MDFSDKKRVVIKIGSNSLTHDVTGRIDYIKIERLAMELSNLRNMGLDVCLVSSGAIAVGRQTMGIKDRPATMPKRQALAAVGQTRLMGIYQQFFSQYNQTAGQVLMTKNTILDNVSRKNAQNTFEQLFDMGIIPIVNANDTVSTYEIQFGDNDTLSAIVASIIGADLLILLSDIDGLFTDDPKRNPDAALVPVVESIDEKLLAMGSGDPGSDVGTGGMATKLSAAQIATASGADMIIANAEDLTMLHRIFEGDQVGTLFKKKYNPYFDVVDLIQESL